MLKNVLEAGFYVARIQDETFSLDTPMIFKRNVFDMKTIVKITGLTQELILQ